MLSIFDTMRQRVDRWASRPAAINSEHNSMSKRIYGNSTLIKQSYQVLKDNKRLLIFPIISSAICLLLLASIAPSLWHMELSPLHPNEEHATQIITTISLLLLVLFIYNLVATFFSTALIASTAHYFKNKQLSLSVGIMAAKSCFPRIILWVLFSTTIGFFLRRFQSRLGRSNPLASMLMGITWVIASYLVVPILLL